MKLLSHWVVWSFVLIGPLSLTGCGGSAGADPMLYGRVGEMCTVHFQRHALGAATSVPISPTTGNFNGADVQISGKLLRVNPGWICLVVGQAEYTIPKEVILMVEVKAR